MCLSLRDAVIVCSASGWKGVDEGMCMIIGLSVKPSSAIVLVSREGMCVCVGLSVKP